MTPSRKIPRVMFSQHPDHASTPFWHKQPLIKTHHELKESFVLFSELGGDEMMWDWEGKLVDDSVIERLLAGHSEFFAKNQIGRDVFITFRVPNPRIESGYRLGRAFMVMLAAEHLAQTIGYAHSPLFEVILPMTESATEMIALRESYKRIAEATHSSFSRTGSGGVSLEVIPIFESVPIILNAANILRTYLDQSEQTFGEKIPYMRPFLARSDPALNSGIVATTLAIKWALSEFARMQTERDISLYPIIAPGALPFRGGLTPDTVDSFLHEFQGIHTLVIQGAFRYDYPKSQVLEALSGIQSRVGETKATSIESEVLPGLRNIIALFEKEYRNTVSIVSPHIQQMSKYIPQRRERVQHIGLFGYSRKVGEHELPRAIGFTASCYSLGIPPELFGLGKALKTAQKEGTLDLVEMYYPGLKQAILRAGHYLRTESLRQIGLKGMEKELETIKEYLGAELQPETEQEKEHAEVVGRILKKVQSGENPHDLVENAAVLRRSIG